MRYFSSPLLSRRRKKQPGRSYDSRYEIVVLLIEKASPEEAAWKKRSEIVETILINNSEGIYTNIINTEVVSHYKTSTIDINTCISLDSEIPVVF